MLGRLPLGDTDHGMHVPASHSISCSHVHRVGTHTHTHTSHLDTCFQSKVFWRKVTGELAALVGGAAVLCVRQGVVSTQHKPSATSEEESSEPGTLGKPQPARSAGHCPNILVLSIGTPSPGGHEAWQASLSEATLLFEKCYSTPRELRAPDGEQP